VGPATVGSDEDGNQKFDVLGNALSWNSLSQLEQFSTTETYVYDALGRLTKVTNGSERDAVRLTGPDRAEVVQELNGAGGVTRVRVGLDRQALRQERPATFYYRDHRPARGRGPRWRAPAHGRDDTSTLGHPVELSGNHDAVGFQGSDGS